MLDFTPWLLGLPSQASPGLAALQAFVRRTPAWDMNSNSLFDYVQVVGANAGVETAALNETLLNYFQRWRRKQRTGILPVLMERLGSIAAVGFGLLFLLILVVAFATGQGGYFLATLANTDHARGFVTFLFILATSLTIVIIAGAIFWLPAAEVAARYASAKDLLAVVIGVVGTILGFYFGSAGTGGPRDLGVSAITLSKPIAAPDDVVTASLTIGGGVPPYKYALSFHKPDGTLLSEFEKVDGEVKTGSLSAAFKVPASVKGAVLVTVGVSDGRDQRMQISTFLFVQDKPAALAPTPVSPAAPP